MLLTPIHLGPSLGLSLVFYRHLDVVVFFIASLVIDLEPAIMFLFGSMPAFYFSHTFLIGAFIGLAIAYLVHFLRSVSFDYWHYLYPGLGWRRGKEASGRKLIISGVAGVWSHLVLDMFVSSDLEPFFPFSSANPLLGILSLGWVYFLSLVCLLISVFVGFWWMIRRLISQRKGVNGETYNMV
jgi:membrane-bound metal-dependent hydrolase YbcI (DUF457 family)